MDKPSLCSKRNKPTILIALLILLGCGQPETSQEPGSVNLKTTDASVIFFNNIRKSNYDVQELDGLNIYRLKGATPSDLMQISIAHRWRDDQANVFLEFNEIEPPIGIKLDADTAIVTFDGTSVTNHLEAAVHIFRGLNGDSILLSSDGIMINLRDSSELMKKFRTVMVDYFNLTENRKFVNEITNEGL